MGSNKTLLKSIETIKAQQDLSEGKRVRLTDSFVQELHELERLPIRFSQGGGAWRQPVNYLDILAAGQALTEGLGKSRRREAIQANLTLRRALLALRYRLEGVNGGLGLAPQVPDGAIMEKLTEAAMLWKKRDLLLNETEMTEENRQQIAKVAGYPAFAALVLENPDLQRQFFEWTLRDKLPMAVFIEYPRLQRRLVETGLSGRVSRVGPYLLRIQYSEAAADMVEKVVTLPFEGQAVSILDDSHIAVLKGNYAVSVGEMFEVFQAKTHSVGNLEFFAQGVVNWNAHQLGWWDANTSQYRRIDLNRAGWWKAFPVTEILSLETARERYGRPLDGVQWIMAACATRSRLTLDPNGSHAFMEMAIPLGDGRYSVYSFGKFALKWATNAFESVLAFTDNHHAAIAYPDENIFFTDRQYARMSFSLVPQLGMQIMDAIKENMQQARESDLIYQWEGENCAKWVQDKLEKFLGRDRVPDLFRIPMLHSEPSDPSIHLFALLKRLPHRYHSPILSFLHFPLGAWRGKWIMQGGKKTWCSLLNSHFWSDKVIYLPAMLHTQNEQGRFQSAEERPLAAPVSKNLALSYSPVIHGQ